MDKRVINKIKVSVKVSGMKKNLVLSKETVVDIPLQHRMIEPRVSYGPLQVLHLSRID